MLKKLLNGEFSLAATFWKFGVLGLLVLNLLIRVFGSLLAPRLQGMSVYNYYTKYFSPVNYSAWTIALSFLYVSSLAFLIGYCYMLIVGTWKSAGEYDKSLWMRFIARVLIIVLAFISLKINFSLPF